MQLLLRELNYYFPDCFANWVFPKFSFFEFDKITEKY